MSQDSLSVDELRSATLRGLRWAVFSRPIVEFLSMASLVVLSRLVSPADFGRYAIALIVLGLGSVTSQGVGVALVQRQGVGREHLQAGLFLALVSGVALVALVVVSSKLIVEPIYGARTADLVLLIAPAVLLSAVSIVPTAILQRRLEFKRLSSLAVVTSVVGPAVSVPLAAVGLNANALVFGVLAATLVATVLVCVWAPPPPPRLRRTAAKDLLSYGGAASLAAVGWVGFANCDYAIIGARLGALQAGFYFRAYSVGVDYQKKVSVLMDTLGFPVLSRAQSDDEQRALRSRMVRLETLVLFPALILLTIVAPVLIPWFFGHQWGPAIVPTQILAIGGAATLVINAVGAGLMATGRSRALLGYGWGHFLAYAAAVFIASSFGIVAVAVAAAVVHGLFLFIAYVLLLYRQGDRPLGLLFRAVSDLWSDIQPATVSSVAVAALTIPVAIGLSDAGVPAIVFLAGVILAGVVAYLGALRLIYPSSFQSLRNLLGHLLPQGWLSFASGLFATVNSRALAMTRSAKQSES